MKFRIVQDCYADISHARGYFEAIIEAESEDEALAKAKDGETYDEDWDFVLTDYDVENYDDFQEPEIVEVVE